MNKVCTKCHAAKPLDQFYKDKRSKDGHTWRRKQCGNAHYMQWRLDHPTEDDATRKQWYEDNADRISEYRQQLRLDNPIGMLLYSAKRRARKRGVPFNITADDVRKPTHCPVWGIELDYHSSTQKANSASLDRNIPSLGYVKGNVVVTSWRANSLKRDATVDELQKLIVYMIKSPKP